LKRLVFQARFDPFIHRWTHFTQALDEEEGVAKAHLVRLYKTLEAELKDLISAREDYIKNKVITFNHLYLIFQPGSTIYSK
jgi:hypothetical protein